MPKIEKARIKIKETLQNAFENKVRNVDELSSFLTKNGIESNFKHDSKGNLVGGSFRTNEAERRSIALKGQDVGFKAKQINVELEKNQEKNKNIDLSDFEKLAEIVAKRDLEKQFEKLAKVVAEQDHEKQTQQPKYEELENSSKKVTQRIEQIGNTIGNENASNVTLLGIFSIFLAVLCLIFGILSWHYSGYKPDAYKYNFSKKYTILNGGSISYDLLDKEGATNFNFLEKYVDTTDIDKILEERKYHKEIVNSKKK